MGPEPGRVNLPIIEVTGGPDARGRVTGRALAEPIHRSLEFYRGALDRHGVSRGELPALLSPYRAAAERTLPSLLAEIEAMAEAADVPFWDLFAANAWEEVEARFPEAATTPERCTAFAASSPDGILVGHNEQWYAGDVGNVAVVVCRPEEGPAFVSPTVVACLPAVGLNASGVAQSIMSLRADDDGEGIPRVLVSRHALQALDLVDLEARAATPGRAGGYAHLAATAAGKAAVVETTANRSAVIHGAQPHTNHYLHPELESHGSAPSPGSRSRLERTRALLEERPPSSPEEAFALLADHEGRPQPICLHATDDPESEAVIFSMVCRPADGRMWVSAGNACGGEPVDLDLGGVLAG